MKKHFVRFLSPGTFCAEETTLPIDSWDVEHATRLADTISERHGATPYGFEFLTRERGDADLDSRIATRSGMYFLGGRLLTLAELERREDPSEDILRSNMKGNGWASVVDNTNSWRWTQPFRDGDVLLDYTPPAKRVPVSP